MRDQDVLDAMQYQLMETPNGGASLSTDQWSGISEFVDALNAAQQRMVAKTGCLIARTTIPGTPQIGLYSLPAGCLGVMRLCWSYTGADGATHVKWLSPTDEFEMDNGINDWAHSFGTPSVYTLTEVPTNSFRVALAPSDIGSFILHYIAEPSALSNSGVPLTVPDDFEPYLRYAAYGNLLGKPGIAADPGRAEYARAREREGIQLIEMLLGGA